MAGSPETPTDIINGAETPLDILMGSGTVGSGVNAVDMALYDACRSRGATGDDVLAIGIMQGAIPLMGQLQTGRFGTHVRPIFDVAKLSTRRDGVGGPGELQVVMPHKEEAAGRHVVVIEDLVDSGRTLSEYLGMLAAEGALSLTVASLIVKPDAREHAFPDDTTLISAFSVHKDLWVVGYGMDIDGRHRGGNEIRAPRSQMERIEQLDRFREIPFPGIVAA